MNFYIITIFPQIFEWRKDNSLIWKAQQKWLVNIYFFNPRDFCEDKHKQIDDEIYWWGAGLLLKAKPFIDAVEYIIKKFDSFDKDFKIIYMAPSKNILTQKKIVEKYSSIENYILVCWRYEGIDYRFEQYMKDKYKDKFERLSIWEYVLMGGEVAGMVFIESVSRLVPWVVKEKDSIDNESYSEKLGWENIEYPQYTRPREVYGYEVPEVLLSWDHKKIEEWRKKNIQ